MSLVAGELGTPGISFLLSFPWTCTLRTVGRSLHLPYSSSLHKEGTGLVWSCCYNHFYYCCIDAVGVRAGFLPLLWRSSKCRLRAKIGSIFFFFKCRFSLDYNGSIYVILYIYVCVYTESHVYINIVLKALKALVKSTTCRLQGGFVKVPVCDHECAIPRPC